MYAEFSEQSYRRDKQRRRIAGRLREYLAGASAGRARAGLPCVAIGCTAGARIPDSVVVPSGGAADDAGSADSDNGRNQVDDSAASTA